MELGYNPGRTMRTFTAQLLTRDQISELWDENGDTFVYLFPPGSGKGPSFKFNSIVFSSSLVLSSLAQGGSMTSRGPSVRSLESATQQMTLKVPETSPTVSPISDPLSDDASSSASRRLANGFPEEQYREFHLYVPVPMSTNEQSQPSHPTRYNAEDTETLVLFRNFFAFLLGQALIATNRNQHLFDVFMRISTLLHRYEFSNIDGSTYGEVVTSSFNHYSNELKVLDVRASREKTIEAIVLGERMRSWPLYNEGFVHGVGKWDDLKGMNSNKLSYISPTTRNRMERAHLDLENRLRSVRGRLDAFDFPSVFAGIANSTALPEAKQVRFQAWKKAFLAMRKHVMSHYKERYGAWPPKARSKKNDFEESGLNRILLREVYQDFSDLYDLLVERKSLTTRTADLPSVDHEGDEMDPSEPTPRAIRRVLSEYDRSTPPVQPPIPFDTPILPTLAPLHRGYRSSGDPRAAAKEHSKRLKDAEVNEILIHAYNRDAMKPSPFIEDFMRLERRSGHGKSIDDLTDNRNGQWIFLYAVIQSLPMLVIDAHEIQFTQGVEYFLCEVPRGTPPWCREDAVQARSWYGVAGGTGVVSLPSDIVDHGVEGIYRRSHCWEMATKWAGDQSQIVSTALQEDFSAPLPPPPQFAGSPHLSPNIDPTTGGSRSSSPLGRSSQRNSTINLGLEALPLPAGVVPVGNESGNLNVDSGFGPPLQRPVSRHDPSKSFDDILKQINQAKGKGKGKK
jgi:hypothetical protein